MDPVVNGHFVNKFPDDIPKRFGESSHCKNFN